MNKFSFNIDGILVEAHDGMTVLEAARNAGLYIPSLCAHKELSPYGACRLCVVEIDGVRGTPTSCTTPAAAGMVVKTNTAQLQTQRRRTLELMMSGHPSACMSCDSREECEMVKPESSKSGVSTRCGACSNRSGCDLRELTIGNFSREMDLPTLYSMDKIERSDPFIDRDHNLCVLCGICFRVCEKVNNGKGAIAIANRGRDAKIASAFEKSWDLEECTFCGACIDECPTGALTDRWSKWFPKHDNCVEGLCRLCPENCKLQLNTKNGKLVSVEKLSLSPDNRLCGLGRFGYAQIVNTRSRLIHPYVLINGEMVPSDTEEVVGRMLEIFKSTTGRLLIAIPENAFYETRRNARAIAKKFSADYVELAFDSESLPYETLKKIDAGGYGAALIAGDFIDDERAQKIGRLICCDFLRTNAQSRAEVVIASTLLSEAGGTIQLADGTVFEEKAVIKKRDFQESLGLVLEKLAVISGVDLSVGDFKMQPRGFKSPLKEGKSALPARFYGHLIADLVPDMKAFGLPVTSMSEEVSQGSYKIIEKEMLVPNFHSVKIHAPDMAKYAKPGQFAILMASMKSERSPFTIIDWNAQEGWVQFVIEEVGRSSSEIGAMKKGDFIANASGPLGIPFSFDAFKAGSSALLLGGCYGVAAIYPIARELKKRGVKITSVIEASTSFLVYFDDKLKEVSDEVIVATRDGTKGVKGGASDIYAKLGGKFDAAVSIGCVFMMKQCAKNAGLTKLSLCALNPIMVDGTGMCGACRVSVGEETKFACVDGPFFDLGKVDFGELAKRRTAYTLLEIEAMPRHVGGSCHK